MRSGFAQILAIGAALGFGLQASFTGVAPWTPSEAAGFGRSGGGGFAGGRLGGFVGGHIGGLGRGHVGGLAAGRPSGLAGGRLRGFIGGHPGGAGSGFDRFGRPGAPPHVGNFSYGFIPHNLNALPHGFAHYGYGDHGDHGAGRLGAGHFAQHRPNHNEQGRDLHGFRPRGFNPNAFGAIGAWFSFGGNLLDRGWGEWGSGGGYWAGPVFWPYLHGDVLTFVLFPYASYNPFFAEDLDLLLASALRPGPSTSASNEENYNLFDIYGQPSQEEYPYSEQNEQTNPNANAASTCDGLAPDVPSLPIDAIERTVHPNQTQRELLDEVRAASARAEWAMRASCPTEVPLTPVGRLDAMTKRLQAMQKAVQILHAPVNKFFASLDQAQEARVEAFGRGQNEEAFGREEKESGNDLGGLCNLRSESFASVPIQRTEELIRPTSRQQAALEKLRAASSRAAKDLDASCPTAVPRTIPERFDAVSKRLKALVTALGEVRPALAEFYDSLTDEQKARFNVIGPARSASSSHNQIRGSTTGSPPSVEAIVRPVN